LGGGRNNVKDDVKDSRLFFVVAMPVAVTFSLDAHDHIELAGTEGVGLNAGHIRIAVNQVRIEGEVLGILGNAVSSLVVRDDGRVT
jgi:hypothetical protein